MTLVKLLKTTSAQVSKGDRWLYWVNHDWAVMERRYMQQVTLLYQGPDLQAAIAALTKEEAC